MAVHGRPTSRPVTSNQGHDVFTRKLRTVVSQPNEFTGNPRGAIWVKEIFRTASSSSLLVLPSDFGAGPSGHLDRKIGRLDGSYIQL